MKVSMCGWTVVALCGCLLAGFSPAKADQLTVTVTDGQTHDPLPASFVMIGQQAGDPFVGNHGVTNASGQILFDDPAISGPQTVTAAHDGYGHATVIAAASSAITLALHPTLVDSTMAGTITHVEGTVSNISTSSNDGNLDFSLILPAVGLSDFVLGERLPFSFGMEIVNFPVIGDIELPENVYAPNQTELLFFQFEKSPWRIDVPGNRTQTFASVAGRISLDALIAGATIDDLTIREVGVERDVMVSGPMNLSINSDLNLSYSITASFGNVAPGNLIQVVTGARIPSPEGEVIVSYDIRETSIDSTSTFSMVSRTPSGDMGDAVNSVLGRYSDALLDPTYSAGIMERDGFTLPHTAQLDSWMQIPQTMQVGRQLSWDDPTTPGVSPAPTWTRSVLGLRPIAGDGPIQASWRVYARAELGHFTLPVLPPEAPGPAGGLPDPEQTPEPDQLFWDFWAANPPDAPGDVVAGFLEGASHWSSHWIPVSIPLASAPEGLQLPDLSLRAEPNPATGRARLSWGGSASGRGILEIVAPDGRLICQREITLAGGTSHWDGRSLKGTHVPAGLYWARIRQNGAPLARTPIVWIR